MHRFLCLVLTTLLLCTPSVLGANLRRRRKRQQRLGQLATKRRHRCPAALPDNDTACRRHPELAPCDYEFVNVPTANRDGSCSGSLTCEPTVQCSCQEETWKCAEADPVDVCEGDLPLASYADCSPDGKVIADNSAEEEESVPAVESEENIKEIFVRNSNDACPATMPQAGSKCARSSDLSECPFDFSNLPVYEEDGTCNGAVSCMPLAGCNCFDGVWDCYTASVRRCRGDTPPQAFQECQLP